MTVVSVSVLKAKLSEYMARVKAGEEVMVTQRGKPVVQLVAIKAPASDERARLERLARQGLIKLGTGKIPDEFWSRPRPTVKGNAAVEAVLADRQERDDAVLGCLCSDTDLRERGAFSRDPAPLQQRR